MKRCVRGLTPCLFAIVVPSAARAEDGYELWLRYHQVADANRLTEYRAAIQRLVVTGDSPTLRAARDELLVGLGGLLGRRLDLSDALTSNGTLIVGTPASS